MKILHRAHAVFTAGASVTIHAQRGCAITRSAVGVYFVDLAHPVAQADLLVESATVSASSRICDIERTSDTRLTVRFFTDAGAATDTDVGVNMYVGHVNGG